MLKGVEGTGYVAIGAGDIGLLLAPQLIYDSTLNGGAGAFLLLNPYLPLFGDGSGGVTTGGLIKTSYNGSGSGGVSIYATGGGIRSDAGGTALYLPNGNIVCQTIAVAGTDEGGAGSGVAIRCTSGAVQSDRFGTAFYAPNGNVVAQNITAMTTLVSDLESRCQELAARVASLESRLVRD
jgi:hypothetical protein